MSFASRIEQAFRRKTNSLNYIPVIDGIRFLAILLVFLFHAAQYFTKQWNAPYSLNIFWDTLLENGHKGVPVFFMLSGFIISLPFARYYLQQNKKPSLKSYYLRRLIRLEPPYLIAMTFFFVIAVSQQPGQWKFLLQSLGASYIYLHTILFRHFPYLNGVAWTLEIEVQFYCLAPLIFLVFKLPANVRRSLLLAGTVLFSLFPLVNPLPFKSLPDYLQYFLPGVLLADFYITGFPAFLRSKIILPLSIVLLGYLLWLPLYHHRYTMPLFPLSIFLFLGMVLGNAGLTKAFSGRIITLIGGMCYSIYLIHGLLIIAIAPYVAKLRIPGGYVLNFLLQAGVYAMVTLIVCSAYFLLLEKPFMNRSARAGT